MDNTQFWIQSGFCSSGFWILTSTLAHSSTSWILGNWILKRLEYLLPQSNITPKIWILDSGLFWILKTSTSLQPLQNLKSGIWILILLSHALEFWRVEIWNLDSAKSEKLKTWNLETGNWNLPRFHQDSVRFLHRCQRWDKWSCIKCNIQTCLSYVNNILIHLMMGSSKIWELESGIWNLGCTSCRDDIDTCMW